MSIFKDIVSIWKSEDLLSQAWDESREMLEFSEDMFSSAIKYLRRGVKIKKLKKLKKEDKKINEFQQNVRKKVVTHFSVSKNIDNLPNGLVLLNMVIDVERLGDYTKNILDMAIYYPEALVSEELLPELNTLENEAMSRFQKTCESVGRQDIVLAEHLLKTHKESLAIVSDDIVHNCISGKIDFENNKQASVVPLYARYLKRIGSHLKNISTTMINPYEYIGYKKQ
jgi:phosphate transport system protein